MPDCQIELCFKVAGYLLKFFEIESANWFLFFFHGCANQPKVDFRHL